MRLLWSLMFLVGSICSAEPMDLTGLWKFHGQVAGAFRLDKIAVVARSDRERQALEEFRSQGFACVHTHSQIYQCKKMLDLKQVPEAHQREIERQFGDRYFDFQQPLGTPTLVSQGDLVTHWSVPAIVYTKEDKASEFHYWELNGLNKVQIPIGPESIWLNLMVDGSLGAFVRIIETADRKGRVYSSEYFYQALFQREKAEVRFFEL